MQHPKSKQINQPFRAKGQRWSVFFYTQTHGRVRFLTYIPTIIQIRDITSQCFFVWFRKTDQLQRDEMDRLIVPQTCLIINHWLSDPWNSDLLSCTQKTDTRTNERGLSKHNSCLQTFSLSLSLCLPADIIFSPLLPSFSWMSCVMTSLIVCCLTYNISVNIGHAKAVSNRKHANSLLFTVAQCQSLFCETSLWDILILVQ